LVVGDFNCPKCGGLMEHGTLRLSAGRGGARLKFKREVLPWKAGEERSKADWEDLLCTGIFIKISNIEARRCTKCSLVLFGY
jgi:hypothetical protein